MSELVASQDITPVLKTDRNVNMYNTAQSVSNVQYRTSEQSVKLWKNTLQIILLISCAHLTSIMLNLRSEMPH